MAEQDDNQSFYNSPQEPVIVPPGFERYRQWLSPDWRVHTPSKTDVTTATEEDLNDSIFWVIWYYNRREDLNAQDLWEYLAEDFALWSEETFKQAEKHLIRELREFLRRRGICTFPAWDDNDLEALITVPIVTTETAPSVTSTAGLIAKTTPSENSPAPLISPKPSISPTLAQVDIPPKLDLLTKSYHENWDEATFKRVDRDLARGLRDVFRQHGVFVRDVAAALNEALISEDFPVWRYDDLDDDHECPEALTPNTFVSDEISTSYDDYNELNNHQEKTPQKAVPYRAYESIVRAPNQAYKSPYESPVKAPNRDLNSLTKTNTMGIQIEFIISRPNEAIEWKKRWIWQPGITPP
ncbi:hypothetical protein MAJ_07441, partial [Metarhizium majus ARSEF 297]